MSTHTRPDSAMEAFTQPRRIYIACVNCRARKVKCISPEDGQPCARCTKKRIECEYLAVPEEQARSSSTAPGGQRSGKHPPRPSASTPQMPPAWAQAPPGYGGSNRGNPQHSGQGYYPQNASQYHAVPGGPPPMTQPDRYPAQPQYPAAGGHHAYNHGGVQNQQPRPQNVHSPSGLPHPQAGAPGYPSDYQQYLANFGLNDGSYPASMYPRRCTCPPGVRCFCGGAR
ncbi:hypothetical protein FB451DRAFT_1277046 [Mycena latifolia]|nr:hypothetical protein FB451DRAFT_1277046 [Mycena latifolia]